MFEKNSEGREHRALLEIVNKNWKKSPIRKTQTIFGNGNIFVKSPRNRKRESFFENPNIFQIQKQILDTRTFF